MCECSEHYTDRVVASTADRLDDLILALEDRVVALEAMVYTLNSKLEKGED
jgi:hypothetical protein